MILYWSIFVKPLMWKQKQSFAGGYASCLTVDYKI